MEYSPVGAPILIGGSVLAGAGPAGNVAAAGVDATFNQLGLDLLHEYCFAAGTLVLTRGGYKLIETLEPGEEVAAVSDADPKRN